MCGDFLPQEISHISICSFSLSDWETEYFCWLFVPQKVQVEYINYQPISALLQLLHIHLFYEPGGHHKQAHQEVHLLIQITF